MGIKIGDLSPLAGMLTGKGALGKAMRQGLGGAIPSAIARNAYSDDEKRRMAQAMAVSGAPRAMKKGGVTRADGCVTKGHTKGRMV